MSLCMPLYRIIMKKGFKLSVLVFVSLFYLQVNAQGVGVQFYQGANKPMVSFEGNGESISYKSNFSSDTRIGIWVGDLSKLSFSTLVGASTVNAIYTSNDIISSFTHSSFLIDVPIRYSFLKSPISSIAVGPSLGVLVASSQATNGIPVRSEKNFTQTNYSLMTEIAFSGYSNGKLSLHPYLSYRMMLNSADSDGDNLRINGLSFGLRMDLTK